MYTVSAQVLFIKLKVHYTRFPMPVHLSHGYLCFWTVKQRRIYIGIRRIRVGQATDGYKDIEKRRRRGRRRRGKERKREGERETAG